MSAENGKKVHSNNPGRASSATKRVVKVIAEAHCDSIAAETTQTDSNIIPTDKVIKSMNGTTATATTTPQQKLSSLKPARDLTLGGRGGGAAAAKKVFTPNLNVVRNKNTNVKTCKDTTARGRGRGAKSERGSRGRGGGRGGATQALIQTTGVFSEGAGAVNIRKATSGGSSSYGRSAEDTPSAMRKPTLIKSENKKLDLQAEASQVRELLGDSDEDDFVDEKTDLEQIPIKLNEESSSIFIAQKIQALHVQQQQQQQATNTALPRYPQTVNELLEQSQPQLFLLQLPDSLPCVDEGDSETSDKPLKALASNDLSSTQTPAESETPVKRLSLKQMEEGKVGKLLRYKSGKVKLVFGDIYFDLDIGMETGFLQDLMSINTNREERSGNMINLGPIQAKLTATPDWEYLLEQKMSQESV